MKKCCSKCGNQLDLGNRSCPSCSAYNPYYIAGFNTTTKHDNGELLLLEKKKVELIIAERQKQHDEQQLQEELRKEQEETARKYSEKLEAEKQAKLEREEEELKLKARQYKSDTSKLVTGVKDTLQQMNEQNAQIAQQFISASQNKVTKKETTTEPALKAIVAKKAFVFKPLGIFAIVLVVSGILGLVYLLYASTKVELVPVKANATTSATPAEPVAAPVLSNTPAPVDEKHTSTLKENANSNDASGSTPGKISVNKVKRDMVHQSLSGCGIVIKNVSDIDYVSTPSLIEKLPSGGMKYRFTTKIKQGGDTYTATPYIYYAADGSFVKIDGTNCE